MKIRIGNKFIGENEPCYIIVEIARTYENNIKKAEKMIGIAAGCGVDAVKIQSIRARDLLVYNKNTADYYKKIARLERSLEEHKQLANTAKKQGVEFLSTPESIEMVDLLEKVGVNAYKVASLDLVYYDFLKYIASKKKPILLSTGMADFNEIEKAIEIIKSAGNKDIIPLHCVSLYPPKQENLNLGDILLLREKFGLITGFSDHSKGYLASLCAVALGAKVIEKHFKIDEWKGSEWKIDYDVAINPKELKEMVNGIRNIEKIIGYKQEKVGKEEKERRILRRRKIIILNDLKKGKIITKEVIACKQNLETKGIDSSMLDKIIGKKLKKDKKKDDILEIKDIENGKS